MAEKPTAEPTNAGDASDPVPNPRTGAPKSGSASEPPAPAKARKARKAATPASTAEQTRSTKAAKQTKAAKAPKAAKGSKAAKAVKGAGGGEDGAAPAAKSTPPRKAARKATKRAAAVPSPRTRTKPPAEQSAGQPDPEPPPGQPDSAPAPRQPAAGQPDTAPAAGPPDGAPTPRQPGTVPAAGQPDTAPTPRQPDTAPAAGQPGIETPTGQSGPAPLVPGLPGAWAAALRDAVTRPDQPPLPLAELMVAELGPRAAAWSEWLRRTYPDPPAYGMARLAAHQAGQLARALVLAEAAGRAATALGLAAMVWVRATVVLRIAAAYGHDPADPRRAADLIALLDLHPAGEPRWRRLRLATAVLGPFFSRRTLTRTALRILLTSPSRNGQVQRLAQRAARFYRDQPPDPGPPGLTAAS